MLRPVLIATVLVTVFSFFFVFPTHDPKPRDLPIGVVGAAGGPPPTVPGTFEVHRYSDAGAARQAIRDREIYGALTPDSTLVASAASFPVANLLGAGGPTTDVVPLDDGDPRGTTIQFAVLAITVPAILGAMLGMQMAPALEPRRRIPLIALFAVVGGLLSMLIIHTAIGALPGSFVAVAGVAALGIAALALFSAAIIAWLGPPGIMASFLLFLMLGNPGSGAASAPELLPEPWATGGQFLPPGALGTALRNAAYFDGAALARPLLVLLAFAVAGAALIAIARGRPVGSPQPA